MSNYAEKNLNGGEEIVFRGKVSFWAIVPRLLWCVIFLIAVIVVSVNLAPGKFLPNAEQPLDPATGFLNPDYDSYVEGMQIVKYIKIAIWVLWTLLGLLPFIVRTVELKCTCLCITNKRVIGKIGVLSIRTLEYPINKVDNVSIHAGVFGNLFHYHTVTVLGGGGRAAQIRFEGIGNATEFKNYVTEAVERHAEEARKAQAEEIAHAMGAK